MQAAADTRIKTMMATICCPRGNRARLVLSDIRSSVYAGLNKKIHAMISLVTTHFIAGG